LYFLEFLEICTIRWVLICEGGVGIDKRNVEIAFFEFFLREGVTTPPPARPIYPRGGDPSTSAPGTATHHRRQGRPRHAPTHTPKRWTRCTGLHSIPYRPRGADRNGGGRWRACTLSDRARPNGQNNKTYKYVVALRVQLDKNVNIRYTITTT
jgi:hypothetical protein